MKARTLIIGTILGGLLVGGCVEREQSVVQSQKERNWLSADSSAISRAEPVEEPRILPQTHFAAARLFEQQGQVEKAIIQYRKAVAVNHDYTDAYDRLGVLLGHLGRHADAEKALRRAVELEPDRATLRNNLGYEYALQGRWADAEAEISNAIRLDPQFTRAHVNLGMVLAKSERFEEALEAFDKVLPEADAFYNLGLMFRSQHRYQDAADAFRHVLMLDADFTAAQRQLEMIAPQLALATELEPSAGLNQWVAVNDDRPAEQVIEPARVAEADTPVETRVATPAPGVEEDETVATLTSSETVVRTTDGKPVDPEGDPRPLDEAEQPPVTEDDAQFTFEEFETSSDATETPPDTPHVPATAQPEFAEDTAEVSEAPNVTAPQSQFEAVEVPANEPAVADSDGDDVAFVPFEMDVWFAGATGTLLSATPELSVDESIGGADPCLAPGIVVVRWR